ncbi:MAG: hypothetical protein EOR85_28375 [Mesorhizobium sp.]|nr:MAG: hypothetical protein EOR79_31600 [Mesorhizobium sp.]RWM92313.1 MAG: hypothetical protein EOR85_28375 [Mesorhizobium sp.]RWN64378.1 MAG: hypothetical protein EOR99_26440 [Mesorhizobium sp.]TIL87299.1 MAG: hypothetical protein E5Y73_25580 [Mesorhizobium sp.]TIM88825.1 MAG: hypothetical protein E5Y50_07440 [Mesorhizobium sp.]
MGPGGTPGGRPGTPSGGPGIESGGPGGVWPGLPGVGGRAMLILHLCSVEGKVTSRRSQLS